MNITFQSAILLESNAEKAELCEGIAEELEANGHCTGSYQNSEGQMCLMGAGIKALKTNTVVWVEGAYHKTLNAIGEALGAPPGRYSEIYTLNDGHGPWETWDDELGQIVPSAAQAPLNKDTAIEHAMKMAKHWREQG